MPTTRTRPVWVSWFPNQREAREQAHHDGPGETERGDRAELGEEVFHLDGVHGFFGTVVDRIDEEEDKL